MLNLSTNEIVVMFVVYIVSGFFLLMKQEETEIMTGQVITIWDRVPVFVPVINTFFAVWALLFSVGKQKTF